MSPKDFFRIVIKILALLFIVFEFVPTMMSIFGWFKADTLEIFIVTGVLVFLIGIIYILVFNTDFVIKIFKLDSGFDSDKFSLSNSSDKKTIQLACLIVGLYMSFSSLPTILQEAFLYFKFEVSKDVFKEAKFDNDYYLYISILSFLVGLLLINFSKQISNLLTSKK